MAPQQRHHLYLISDATGETLHTIARACLVQFEDIDVVEHAWPMVRTERALDTVLEELATEPGLVLYTLLDEGLSGKLQEFCRRNHLRCISVLEPFIDTMAQYFQAGIRRLPGQQHVMDDEYFSRIDAINFVMTHDDGQATGDLTQAEVILVGVSRTSKTPTCIYLANRGIKAANVPIVPGATLPDILFKKDGPLVVGLIEDPRRLVEIRRNRLRLHHEDADTSYTDFDAVKKEIADARRLFARNGWPVIDVTRRSIEETAASIIQLFAKRGRLRKPSLEDPTAPGISTSLRGSGKND